MRRKKTIIIPPRKVTVRGMLSQIEDFLLHRDDKAAALWDVLSALRGPDERSENKNATTIHIRRRAFPRLSKLAEDSGPRRIPASFITYAPFDPRMSSSHFTKHIRKAAKVLRLKDTLGH